MSEMDITREIAKSSAEGTLYLFLGGTFSTAISAVTSILIARLLGPTLYGLYSLSMTPAAMLLIASGFGVNVAVVKFISESDRRGDYHRILRIVKTALVFQLIIGLLLSSLILIFSSFLSTYVINRPQVDFLVKITSIYILGTMIFNTANQIYIGLNRMDRSAIITFLQSISKFAAAIGLILAGYSVFGAVIGHSGSYLFAGAIGLIMLYIVLRNYNVVSGAGEDGFINLLSKMVRYGFPVYLTTVIISFLGVYRNILLSVFATDLDIGNLMASLNLTTAITIFINPISIVLFPAFSRLDVDAEIGVIRELFVRAVKFSSLIILPVTFFIIFFSRDVTFLFYGYDFRDTPIYLILAATQYLLTGLGFVVLGSFFNGVGETNIVFKMGFIQLVISLISYPLLLYYYHIIGLLVGMLSSFTASTFYGIYLARKKFRVSINPISVSKIYISSFIAGLITYLLRHQFSLNNPIYNTALYALIFLFIYLITLTLIGGITLSDINLLEMAFEDVKVVNWFMKYIFRLARKILVFLGR